MSETVYEPLIPTGGLLAGGALVLFALLAVTTARLTGAGGTRMVLPAAIEIRDLNFADGDHGTVLVYDFQSKQLVDTLAPGSNGFIRVVLRGLARERRLAEIGAEPPFRLTRFVNGQLTLTDTSSGKQIDLAAFGAANVGAFARLMMAGGAT
jgi:putative photosynthetic complex assembly protein